MNADNEAVQKRESIFSAEESNVLIREFHVVKAVKCGEHKAAYAEVKIRFKNNPETKNYLAWEKSCDRYKMLETGFIKKDTFNLNRSGISEDFSAEAALL